MYGPDSVLHQYQNANHWSKIAGRDSKAHVNLVIYFLNSAICIYVLFLEVDLFGISNVTGRTVTTADCHTFRGSCQIGLNFMGWLVTGEYTFPESEAPIFGIFPFRSFGVLV